MVGRPDNRLKVVPHQKRSKPHYWSNWLDFWSNESFNGKNENFQKKIEICKILLILSMVYEQFRAFHSAENRDRNFCPIDLKFDMTILD